MDELGCVECLAACAERCSDAGRILAQAPPGLLALACCLTSSLNRSRVIALQVSLIDIMLWIYVFWTVKIIVEGNFLSFFKVFKGLCLISRYWMDIMDPYIDFWMHKRSINWWMNELFNFRTNWFSVARKVDEWINGFLVARKMDGWDFL